MLHGSADFGYGFDTNDKAMTGAVALFSSMFLELGLEVAVDGAAMEVERENGIDLDHYHDDCRFAGAANEFGMGVASSLLALFYAFWTFSNIPTPFFCQDVNDPCSCKGGGFEIVSTFCNVSAQVGLGLHCQRYDVSQLYWQQDCRCFERRQERVPRPLRVPGG